MKFPCKKLILPALLAALQSLAPALVAQKPPSAPQSQKPASVAVRRQALNDLFHDYWQAYLKHDPEFASLIGDSRYNNQVSDYSNKAVNDWLAEEQSFLMRLVAIDATGFTAQQKLSQQLLERRLEDDQRAAQFKQWEMPVTQVGGVYLLYPQLASELNFTTAKDYDDWIARLRALPEAFSQTTENMEIGMEDGRVPPKSVLQQALAQVTALAHRKPEDSPLAAPLKNIPASIPAADRARIQTEMLAVIAKQVLPAYLRFERFLQVSYVPAGRANPCICALPDGARYYRFLIDRITSSGLTAEQIHQIGLVEVQKDEAEELAIAQKLGFKDLAGFRASLKTNLKLHPVSAAALLDAYRAALAPVKAKLPLFFADIPKQSLAVAALPDYLSQAALPAVYRPSAIDGSRPARLLVNTYNASARNLYQVQANAYDQGIPGQHLQISMARENAGLPDFRRYQRAPAFTQGWGLYAAQLGKEAGLDTDSYSDYGRIDLDLQRAIGLVADTGVHSQHWTRQQIVDYFHQHSSLSEAAIQAETDRVIALPGLALGAKIGELEIAAERGRAQKTLGAKFNLKSFHHAVLGSGSMPLDIFQQHLDAWIASQSVSQPETSREAQNR